MKRSPYITKQGVVLDKEYFSKHFTITPDNCWIHGNYFKSMEFRDHTNEKVRLNIRNYLWELENRVLLDNSRLCATCGFMHCHNPEHLTHSLAKKKKGPTQKKNHPVYYGPVMISGHTIDPKFLLRNGYITLKDNCWICKKRYLRYNGEQLAIKRYLYQIVKGPLKEDVTLKNICGNPHCVKPSHQMPSIASRIQDSITMNEVSRVLTGELSVATVCKEIGLNCDEGYARSVIRKMKNDTQTSILTLGQCA